jgi:hypothetical protein
MLGCFAGAARSVEQMARRKRARRFMVAGVFYAMEASIGQLKGDDWRMSRDIRSFNRA